MLITAPRVIPAAPGRQILMPGWVEVRAGTVTAVAHGDPPRAPDVELPAGTLLPGLVDLQDRKSVV